MKLFHFIFTIMLIAAAFFLAQKSIENLKQNAVTEASTRLALTRDIRIAQLENEVKTMYSEARFWAESAPLSQGMAQILLAWNELSKNPKDTARKLYITNNPLYPNYTADFDKADDGSSYSESHQTIHRLIRGLTQQRGYFDILLIANNGDIVYSVFKEDEFATNILTGRYKNTALAQGFREVQDNTNLNHVALTDFSSYEPSQGISASFIETSIVNKDAKTIGILAFELPIAPLDKIISNPAGLAKGATVLAVGGDKMMRNRINSEIQTQKVTSIAIDAALAGKTGVKTLDDYRGVKSIAAYAPFHFSQNVLGNTAKNTWAIIVKQDLKEVLKPVNKTIKERGIILGVLTLLSLILAWLVTNRKEDLTITED